MKYTIEDKDKQSERKRSRYLSGWGGQLAALKGQKTNSTTL